MYESWALFNKHERLTYHILYLTIAHTSPPRFRRQAVAVRYSVGFSRYASSMKFRQARYLNKHENQKQISKDQPFSQVEFYREASYTSFALIYSRDFRQNTQITVYALWSYYS